MSSSEIPSAVIAAISFIGRDGGWVKSLGGFKKGHHSVPDVTNAVTNAFLGKICGGELGERAEKFFQNVRTGLGYKRKDIALAVAGGSAQLTAKDFSLEILYALEERDAARYAVTTTLHGVRNAELARAAEFTTIFAGKFSEISFAFKKSARVEAVVDVIEALDGNDGIAVSYPSDCRECEIAVEGVDAKVRCTAASLEMVFPRAASPAELMDGFAAVRGAFAMSKPLAGLIG